MKRQKVVKVKSRKDEALKVKFLWIEIKLKNPTYRSYIMLITVFIFIWLLVKL
jgi:hypothetical protein